MIIRIYLIRHAEAQTNVDPLFKGEINNLTKKGVQQAKSTALRFRDTTINCIYTSEIHRAQLTAQEIEKITGNKPVILDFLKERKGSHSATLEYVHTETFEDLKKRLKETKDYLEKLPHKYIIIVSHAEFLKALISYIMHDDLLSETLLSSMSKKIILDNASISKLIFNTEKSKWHIESLNDKNHLY